MRTLTQSGILGFLTVVLEQGAYLGGYLLTNLWRRPLEFRLTTTVQPSRLQQVLYGATLRPFIYADLIGKALFSKTTVQPELVITDSEPLLDLRLHIEKPLVWLAEPENELARSLHQSGAGVHSPGLELLVCHPRFVHDAEPTQNVLTQLERGADLREPFSRIREALQEARKLGVTTRGA
jgi:hypothetical protein